MHASRLPSSLGAALVLPLLGAACARLPPLGPVGSDQQAAAVARCRQAFPPQPWRATHTLFATLPLGYNGALLGVAEADAEGLHAILLSPEGITLFDAVQKLGPHRRASLLIYRAVPPLDRFDFAASLIADVESAFLPPGGDPTVGANAAGQPVCRWSPPGGDATEVELAGGRPSRIRTYRNQRVSRDIELFGTPAGGFFPEVRLTVPGGGGYTLDMKLVDHE